MKWIGQHIYDQVSRFRNKVYIGDDLDVGDNIVLTSAAGRIDFAGTAGGGSEAITYKDSAGTQRNALHFPGSNVVALSNRGSNGAVHIRANTSTAGSGGEVTVATFTDTEAAIDKDLTVKGTTSFTNGHLNNPVVEITNTGNNTSGGKLKFTLDKGAVGADNDVPGGLQWISDNDAQEQTTFGQLYIQVADATDGQEAGAMYLQVAEYDGSITTGLKLDGDTNADGEVDVTVGAGAASTTTVAGTLTMGSTAFVNNSGVVQVATQGTIDHNSLANYDANRHFVQSSITTVGTIGTGVWQGTALATAYIADDAVTFAKASGVSPNVFGNTIKLIPSDFGVNDDGGNQKFGVGYVETAGTGYGMRSPNSNAELFAFVSIPEGMKATHVNIHAKSTYSTEVFEAQIDATTMSSKGTGNCNTNLDITDVNATATNFLAIMVSITATTDKVYGGTVTIAAI